MLRDLIGHRGVDDLKEELFKLYEKLYIISKDMRPWSEFFGSFKIPQLNVKHTEQRMTTNFLHYFSNYFAICSGLFLIQIVLCPSMMITLPVIVIIDLYVVLIIKKPITVGQVVITDSMKRAICTIFTLLYLTLCGILERLIWYMIYCLLVCGLHMLSRPRSVTSKTNKVYEDLKMNGFSWYGSDAKTTLVDIGNEIDPENPPVRNDDYSEHKGGYSSSYGSGTDSTVMRKRGSHGPYSGSNQTYSSKQSDLSSKTD